MSACVIAIAGPSGSGKSLFAHTLCHALARDAPGLATALIKEDAYYRDQGHLSLAERATVNYDHPQAIEQELLLEHLSALRSGRAVAMPQYDYAAHTRHSDYETVQPAPVIIVEGILLLTNPSLRAAFDFKFYIDTPLDLCLQRRIERDTAERGRSLASVVAQYSATVRPMYHEFIRPSAEHADMLITGGGRNRAALDVVRRLVLSLASVKQR